MAGIGFSLRATGFAGGSLAHARSIGGAAVVSSGPWALAVIGMLALGQNSTGVDAQHDLERFRVAVTWVLAAALVWTSPLQLTFARFVADREYMRERQLILPNVLGALMFVSVASALLAISLAPAFENERPVIRVLLGVAFVCTCDAWMISLVLASLREHRAVLGCFAAGYLVVAVGCCCAPPQGRLAVHLGAFAAGQATLLFLGIAVLARRLPRAGEGGSSVGRCSANVGRCSANAGRGNAPTARRDADARSCGVNIGLPLEVQHAVPGTLAFGFLRPTVMMGELALAALAFNLGCWTDALGFSLDPFTSRAVIGPLRASPVYDLPYFAASVCVLPGAAIFIVHVETELARRQRAFFDAVLGGATLKELEHLSQLLTDAARGGGASLVRTQALAWLAFVACAPSITSWLTTRDAAQMLFASIDDAAHGVGWPAAASMGIDSSSLHVPLACVSALALALQLLVSALLSGLYYLDRRRQALMLSLLCCASNAGLSWMSHRLGPSYYGFGHALAMGLSFVAGLALFNRALANLVRDTFMLQPAATT